jgi:hypothetical protein
MTSPLAALKLGVLRPRDASGIYAQPYVEFLRWEREGVLLKVAHGYYAHVPESSRRTHWRPEIESLALGIAQADYGKNEVALMHISAARLHGAIPRAVAVAVLAVPKQRPNLETSCGRIVFVRRDVNSLKKVRVQTELATGWCTSLEQTVLDLARRPDLVEGLSEVSKEAARTLFGRANEKKLQVVLDEQRMGSAMHRLEDWTKSA